MKILICDTLNSKVLEELDSLGECIDISASESKDQDLVLEINDAEIAVIRSSTKLPIIMDAEKTILIFVLVLVMCMGSAAVAMRKLVDADPAEIF